MLFFRIEIKLKNRKITVKKMHSDYDNQTLLNSCINNKF